jgi:hypothetical protein
MTTGTAAKILGVFCATFATRVDGADFGHGSNKVEAIRVAAIETSTRHIVSKYYDT